ncbi:MAG: GAF domain-containing protein [Chloroflexota bacterium]
MRIPTVEKQSPEYVLQQIRYVTSLSMNAAEAETLEQVLQQIADAARELIGAKYAALGVPNNNGGLRYFKVSGISQVDIHRIEHRPVGIGLLGSIMQTRKPVRLNNMREHPRAAGFPEGHPHMTSLLGMPVMVGEQLFGTFYLCDKDDGQPFTEEDEWLLEMMAASAGLAIAGAQIREQQNDLARLAERERIAMELHDSVIQSLYALGLGLDFASRAETVPPEMISETLKGLNTVIEDIRAYILKLNKGNGNGHIPLREHIDRAIADLYIPQTLAVYVNAPVTPSALEYDVIQGIQSILHECLSNVIRHSQATDVNITVTEEHPYFRLVIADNGVGFDVSRLEDESGLGLQNIHRRARLYGGAVDIESTVGGGTIITLTVPLIRL